MTLRITLVPTKSAFGFGGGCVVTGVEFSLNFGGCVVLWVGKKSKGVNNTRESRMGGRVKCTHT